MKIYCCRASKLVLGDGNGDVLIKSSICRDSISRSEDCGPNSVVVVRCDVIVFILNVVYDFGVITFVRELCASRIWNPKVLIFFENIILIQLARKITGGNRAAV